MTSIANTFYQISFAHKDSIALYLPKKKLTGGYSYSTLTFLELASTTHRYAQFFEDLGLMRGHKVAVFLKPGREFVATTFALYQLGCIPIFMDPGMGLKRVKDCLGQVEPDAMISETVLRWIRPLMHKELKSVRFFFTKEHLKKLKPQPLKSPPQCAQLQPKQMAALLFTSGATGAPKGVIYTHEIFQFQIKSLKNLFQLQEGDIDLAAFPLFGLFSLSMGVSVCFPDMNPSRPAQCRGEKIIQHILDLGITFAGGSPTIWERVANVCLSKKITLPSLKTIATFGAPVSVKLHLKYQSILCRGSLATPYGATECLPVALIHDHEVLNQTAELSAQGMGTCVGQACPEVQIKIIQPTVGILDQENLKELPANNIGEILVSSPAVTLGYYKQVTQTQESKYFDGEKLWHRMGDLGHLDPQNRLWFCGRKSHSFKYKGRTYYTTPIEGIFLAHPKVQRCALIGLPTGPGNERRPYLVVEKKSLQQSSTKELISLKAELLELAQKFHMTKDFKDILFYPRFPVDPRHNIKIDRPLLARQFIKRKEHHL